VEIQRPRKIISTATGDDKNRKPESDQLGKVAVNGSVTAEDDYDLNIARVCGRAIAPLGVAHAPEPFHVLREIARAKNGGSAHETEVLSELRFGVIRQTLSCLNQG
jgi:hypothetical protein